MILEGILSAVLGAGARLVPEALAFFGKREEHAHELKMLELSAKLEEVKQKAKQEESRLQADTDIALKDIEGLIKAVEVQGKLSGNPWIDALSASVRPVLTYWWCVFIYSGVLWARFSVALKEEQDAAEAVLKAFGPFEQQIVGAMIGYWFMDRTIKHMKT